MPTFRGPGLNRPFWLLWWATTASSLGDGIRWVAFPLIAASISRDPGAVALVSAAGLLAWPLFGLVGGAVVDRTDRRRLMWRTDVVRAVLVGAFTGLVAAGNGTIAALAIVSFLLGVAETFFDNAASAIVPQMVDDTQIELANSWIMSTQTVMLSLVGAPVGGALFALARSVPPAFDAASFALSALLIVSVRGRFRVREHDADPTTIRADIMVGLRWLVHHRQLRTLALLLGVLNATFGAADAVLVLYSLEVLHLSNVGYGILLALLAIGGLIGSALAGPINRRIGLTAVIGITAGTQGVLLLVVGLTSTTGLTALALFLVGGTTMVWNVVTVSLRQRIVPSALLGRVTSSYRVIGLGAMPIGAAVAGLLAKAFTLHTPYLVGGTLTLIATAAALPFVNEKHDMESA